MRTDSGSDSGHITTTLAFRWYDEIESGRKKVEFREAKPYWDRRLLGRPVRTITFMRGYTARRMTFAVRGVHRLAVAFDGRTMERTVTELPLERIDPKTTYAIHLGERLA